MLVTSFWKLTGLSLDKTTFGVTLRIGAIWKYLSFRCTGLMTEMLAYVIKRKIKFISRFIWHIECEVLNKVPKMLFCLCLQENIRLMCDHFSHSRNSNNTSHKVLFDASCEEAVAEAETIYANLQTWGEECFLTSSPVNFFLCKTCYFSS